MRALLLSSRLPELQGLYTQLNTDKRVSNVRQIDTSVTSVGDIDFSDLDLIILDEQFGSWISASALESLCRSRPDLLVMLVSRQENAELFVQAVSAGVREILLWPASGTEIDHAIGQALEKIAGLGVSRHGEVISIIAAKGGSGATFLTTNLGYCCTSEFDRRTLIIDLDLQYGDASFALGEQPRPSHIGLLAQDDNLDASFFDVACLPLRRNLSLLAAPVSIDDADFPAAESMGRVLALAARSFDLVLIDLPPRIDSLGIAVMTQSNSILQVIAPTVTDLRNQQLQARYLHERGIPLAKTAVVLNKMPAAEGLMHNDHPYAEEINVRLAKQTIARVPCDEEAALLALGAGVSVNAISKSAAISKAVLELASKISAAHVQQKGWRERLTSWIANRHSSSSRS